MANINDKVTYTIIEEVDYNDVVKTTMDGVRLLRTPFAACVSFPS